MSSPNNIAMLRKIFHSWKEALPYLTFVVPLAEWALHRGDAEVSTSILDLKSHVDSLNVSIGAVTAAIEEEQHRQDRLERQYKEVKETLEALAHEQADLIEQVRSMTLLVRATALSGTAVLILLIIIKAAQIIHLMVH
jgi:septal ring factor EnvC (AmiA/AmiB activator)